MRISASLPQGVTSFLFEAARRRRALDGRLGDRLEAGFAEVVLPVVDYLEPYEPLLTAASRGELYRFIDRDGELLALRADFTPMLARLLAPMLSPASAAATPLPAAPAVETAPSRRPLELPQRLFYRGDVAVAPIASSAAPASALAAEAADLLYHLLVLLLAAGVPPEEVAGELRRRHARASTPDSPKPEERP